MRMKVSKRLLPLAAACVVATCAALGLAGVAAAAAAPANPAGHWAFDDPAGSTVAVDSSGSGNNAYCGWGICPALGVAGAVGTATSLAGAGDFWAVANTVPGDFTISAWIQTPAGASGGGWGPAYSGQGIIWSDIGGGAPDMIPLAFVNDRVAFGTGEACGGGYDTLTSSVPVNTGSWVHVVVTRSQLTGQKQMYIDGVLDGTSVGSPCLLDANGQIALGGNPLDNRFFQGLLDDVYFYDRVLSPAEIGQLYAIGAPDTTAPVVTVPADTTVEATGPSGATVSFAASATDNVDGTDPVTCSPASGSVFPIGSTTVTCSATDAAGNTGSATFSVKVPDTTAPVASASLVAAKRGGDDESTQSFRVVFSASDAVGVTGLTATLNGIPVTNGQIVTLKTIKKGAQKVTRDDGRLGIQATSFLLTVTASDAAGNVGTATAAPVFNKNGKDDEDRGGKDGH